MNIHVRNLTPTQVESIERSKRFHAAIKAKAAELTALVSAAAASGIVVKTIEPEAMPAEPDPPAPNPWFSIIDCVPIKRTFPTINEIKKVVCQHYPVTPRDLVSRRRDAEVVRPRQVVCFLAKSMTPHSLPEIGRRLGNRDHTTVLHSVRKITRLMKTDRDLAAEIESFMEVLAPSQSTIQPLVPEQSSETEQGIFRAAQGESLAPEGEGAGRGGDLRAAEHQYEEAFSVPQGSSAAAPGSHSMTKHTFFANIYPSSRIGSRGSVYETREVADEMAASNRLMCVAFEVEIPNEDSPDAPAKSE
jgi:hypothetical protein